MDSRRPSRGAAPRREVRRDIEGLRAVAVLMVLAFHLRVPGTEGGFAGVDVFFVISGFLITGLMLREIEAEGTVRLARFYARRARRLLPAALTVITATLLAGWWVLPGSQLRHLVHDSIGATFYVVNWVLSARSVDYLAEDAGVSPLQHYWTLSVEEQFYLLWPLLVLLGLWLAARRHRRLHGAAGAHSPASSRRWVLGLLTVVGVGSFCYSVVLTATQPAPAYFSTFTRLWELAAGALLAFAVPHLARLPQWTREVLVLAGLAAVLATTTAFHAGTPWPGWAAAVPVLGSAAVIAAGSATTSATGSATGSTATGSTATGRTVGARLLGIAPLVWIGGLSYAIYLWHWPLLVLAESWWGALSWPSRAALGVASVLLAWATKHLVEDPIRFHRGLARRSGRSLALGGTVMVLVSALALGLLTTRPALEDGTDLPGPAALVAEPDSRQWELAPDPTEGFTTSGELVPHPDLAPEDVPVYYDDGCQIEQGDPAPRFDCVYGDPESATEVLLVGDSKAGQWFSAVESIARDEGWRLTTYLKSTCPLTVAGAEEEDCTAHGQEVLAHVTAQPDPPDLVLLSMGAAHDADLAEGAVSAVRQLQDAGIEVVVLADNPYPPGSRYPCAAEHPEDLTACSFEREIEGGHELLSAVAEEADTPVVDLNQWICPEGQACPVAVGGLLVWRQGSHLTDTYVRALTPFLYRELSALGLTDATARQIGLEDVPERDESGEEAP